LVYSFGSNNDFSFEAGILEMCPCCVIHVFDMTSSPPKTDMSPNLHFHKLGLGATDSTDIKSMTTHRNSLGHDNSEVDLVKVDIEGAEYNFFENELLKPPGTGALSHFRYLMVEFHLAPNLAPTDPQRSRFHKVMQGLHDHGFVITHKEANWYCTYCIEYTFVRLVPGWWSAATPS